MAKTRQIRLRFQVSLLQSLVRGYTSSESPLVLWIFGMHIFLTVVFCHARSQWLGRYSLALIRSTSGNGSSESTFMIFEVGFAIAVFVLYEAVAANDGAIGG